MNILKKISWGILLVCLGCAKDKDELPVKVNEQLNIIVTPDLSNRIESSLYPKPVADTVLINAIYDDYFEKLYHIRKRVLGQKDRISMVFTNPAIINKFDIKANSFTLDLSNKLNADRISYLKGDQYKNDLSKIHKKTAELYHMALKNITGGDIYNYLKEQLNDNNIKSDKAPVIVEGTQIINRERNIVIMFTDGYIEAGLYGNSNCIAGTHKCFYLDKTRIDNFRKEFKKSDYKNLHEFFDNSDYGVVPVDNKVLPNVELLVVELYDRSLNLKTGSQTIVPNDYDILQLFWQDWLKKSGVKHFKLMKYTSSKEDFINSLVGFINEDPNDARVY
ncbi:hypothetical protein ACG2LH_16015 [Zhouia sp. PK063]|uniref:hypothetical protein n=1 Tax=Zhouia sp. PK063 TaxID=3373602 RepID=UPI0037BCB3C4